MINPKICPFCKKENNCMADIPNNNCWCNDIKVPKELILLVPAEYEHKACICKNCILQFKENKDKFIQNLK
ncbi:MAG: hypothetical protein C0625_13550 [Arcobacter sp.]|nr:MAG: hypothetical protein C0625_13550 [Arcobacter sp.]